MQDKRWLLALMGTVALLTLLNGLFGPVRLAGFSSSPNIDEWIGQLETGHFQTPLPTHRSATQSKFSKWNPNPVLAEVEIHPINVPSESELILYGIAWDEDRPTAIINNEIYAVGEKIHEAVIKAIREDAVVLEQDGHELILRMGGND